MVLYELSPLMKEIERVYNEHYKDCKHQEVHDFYRATVKRFRTAYQKNCVRVTPIICCWQCTFYDPENSSNRCSHPKGLCNPGESDFCSYGRIREVGE